MNLTQLKRNECIKLVRQSNRKLNKVRYSVNETKEHKAKKREICQKLENEGKQYITEAIFETGGRADVLVLDNFTVIEILHTEKPEEFEKKKNYYPNGLKLIAIKTGE